MVLVLLLAALLQEEPLPADLAGWMRRQDAQVERGEGEKALAEAKARVEREPKSVEALFVLGRILGNAGKVDEARAKFQAALDADPNYSPAWRGMSLVHKLSKDFETAAREARRAYELEESPENRVLLVQALFENGDRLGAYRLLKDALAKSPGDNDLRSFYASRLLAEGLLRDAEREVRQVLATDANHLAARQMLVAVLTNTGRKEDAAAECREFIKRSPKDLDARLLLYGLLVGQKEFSAAAAVLEDLLKMDLPADLRGEAEVKLKNLRAALEEGPGAPEGVAPPEVDARQIFKDLEDKDVEVRRAAMRTLWENDLNSLPGPLLVRVHDEDEIVRLYAVRLIGRFGDERTLWILNLLLFHSKRKDPALAIRVRAVQAVGKIGSPAGLLLLFRAIQEPEPEILGAAVLAVRDITGKCLVDDPDGEIPADGAASVRERAAKWWFEDATAKQWRRKAAEAAAAMPEVPSRELAWYLVPWVQEEAPEIRAAMLDAFARLSGDPAWRDLPSGTKEEREAVRDRAYAFLAEKDGAEKEKAEKK